MKKFFSSLHRMIGSETSGSLAWILMVTLSAFYVVEFCAERIL